MDIVIDLYRRCMPVAVRNYLGNIRTKKMKGKCFEKIKSGKWMFDFKNECEYMISKGELVTFPYEWTDSYCADDVQVLYDTNKKMPYILIGSNRLYFPKKYSKKYIQKYFNSILIEQDPRSSRYYFEPTDSRLKDGIFFDIGGAEGFISLQVVPYVDRILIFECDKDWIKALKATFDPWRDKVFIINKYVSSKTCGKEICLDDVDGDLKKVILKIDVEGMEEDVLKGADKLLRLKDTQVYVCAYHKKNDEQIFSALLRKYGFHIEKSDGYMFYGLDDDAGFRKGIIRAIKGSTVC